MRFAAALLAGFVAVCSAPEATVPVPPDDDEARAMIPGEDEGQADR